MFEPRDFAKWSSTVPVIETLAGLILSPSLGEEERPLVVWAVSSGGVGTLGGGGGGGGLTCLGELDVI